MTDSSGGGVDALYDEVRKLASIGGSDPSSPTPALAIVRWRRPGGYLEVFLPHRAVDLPFPGPFRAVPEGHCATTDGCPQASFHDATWALVDETSATDAPASVTCETDRGAWVRPRDALAGWSRGAWLLPSTVVTILAELERGVDGIAERLAAAARVDRGARLWPLADAIRVAPLRTLTLPPATHTNAYVIGARDLAIVDPGSGDPDEQAALAREVDQLVAAGARASAVLLTHHHGDHASGAAALAAHLDAPVLAHAETARRLTGRVAVDRALADGDVVELAGDPPRRLRAIFTPGHAPGHLCFLEEETGWAVVGDMVASVGTILVDPSEGDMRAYLASLDRLAALRPRALLPAHGGAIADPQAKLAAYTRHRLWREERVVSALRAARRSTPAGLVPAAYSDVSPTLFGLAERSLLAHLVKLAADGRAREVDGEWEPVDD